MYFSFKVTVLEFVNYVEKEPMTSDCLRKEKMWCFATCKCSIELSGHFIVKKSNQGQLV